MAIVKPYASGLRESFPGLVGGCNLRPPETVAPSLLLFLATEEKEGALSSGEKLVISEALSCPEEEEEPCALQTFLGGPARRCSPKARQTVSPPARSAECSSAYMSYCQTADQNGCS